MQTQAFQPIGLSGAILFPDTGLVLTPTPDMCKVVTPPFFVSPTPGYDDDGTLLSGKWPVVSVSAAFDFNITIRAKDCDSCVEMEIFAGRLPAGANFTGSPEGIDAGKDQEGCQVILWRRILPFFSG